MHAESSLARVAIDAEPRRVIVADDDFEMRRLLRAVLRRQWVTVVEVASGEELVERVRELVAGGVVIDLVISDVQMPSMTGIEAIAAIRPMLPDVPVILITAYASAHVREEAHSVGSFAVLAKPFHLESLTDHVAAALDRVPTSGEI